MLHRFISQIICFGCVDGYVAGGEEAKHAGALEQSGNGRQECTH